MIADLYAKLKALKVNVRVVDGSLDVQAPKGVLDREWLETIKAHKEELIDFIESHIKTNGVSTAILRIAEQPSYPLSAAQRRLWVVCQSEQACIAYNMSGIYLFEGNLNKKALSDSCYEVIRRHESLRTVFREDGEGNIRQFILPPDGALAAIAYQDLRQEKAPSVLLPRLLQANLNKPFKLSEMMVRMYLYQLQEDQWVFAYVVHHIISDGWSVNILIREIITLYNAFRKGEPGSLPSLPIQYKDYAAWQQQQLNDTGAHATWWKEQFAGVLPVLQLPADTIRPAVKTYNGAFYSTMMDAEPVASLREYCQRQRATLYMGLLAVAYALCYRYTGQTDIIIGSPVAGRQHADLESQIGFYANTLALRAQFNPEDPFDVLLQQVKQTVTGAFEHQAFPFDELVEALQLQRDVSRNPLFDIQVLLQHADSNEWQNLEGLSIKKYEGAARYIGAFDMVLNFVEINNTLDLRIVYNPDVYAENNITRLATHFKQLLAATVKAPEIPVYQLPLLSEAEKHHLLYELNNTAVDFGGAGNVIALFKQQVAAIPDAIAVVFEDISLTYRQLDEQSDRLAAYLKNHCSIQKEEMIGVLLDRSEKVMIAAYGILKAGGVYVPVDPEIPRARKEFIIQDTGIKTLITKTDYIFDLEYFTGTVIALDVQLQDFDHADIPDPRSINPKQLAYVIYTSGSTGQPKGAMIEHGSLANSMQSMNAIYEIRQREKFLQFYSLSFDVSVFEIFSSPVAGAEMHIIKDEDRKNPELLEAFLNNHQIEIAGLPTALLHQLQMDKIPALQKLIVGGEPSNPDDVAAYVKNGILFNAYGPTEAAICTCLFRINKGTSFSYRNIPIGKPIANDRVYILDAFAGLCPVGVVGEICIGGAGLARGYLNRPELTAEKFMADPFRAGERLYRTGDLGKWLPDGTLVFMGRKDEQVKIRGYRIELGEIETVLQAHPKVEAALVLVKVQDGGEKELVAYVIGRETLQVPELRSWLSASLPHYMVPAHFVQLAEWPLTTNGKIDKRQLPDPADAGLATGSSYEAPRTEEERILVTVCEEVLKKHPVGIRDDFFVLGGDSIKSIQVVARLKQRGFTLGVQDVLLHPLLEELAGRMSRSVRAISQETVEGMIPLSPVQHWFFSNGSAHKHHYNQSVLLHSRERLSAAGIRAALEELVLHHDALRMVYRPTAEGWEQENRGADQKYSFEVLEDVAASDLIGHCDRLQAGIHLAEGPLVHACLFKGAAEDRLLIVIHHLVTDGVSWRILLEDLGTLYEQYVTGAALVLPEKTDSFRYWQEQQLRYSVSDALKNEEAWWSQLEAGTYAPLPTDHREGSNLEADRTACSFLLDEQLTEQLMTRCYQAYHTTINDILLTALGLAVSSLMGGEQLLISLEGHGREELGGAVDVSRTVGWFTTMYPVVLDMRHKEDRIRQLLTIKEHLHRVPNKGVGYGILRYLSGKPYRLQPSISFNYLGDFGDGSTGGRHHPLGELSGESQGRNISGDWVRDALLDVTGITVAGRLRLSVSYSRQQYEAERIEQLTGAYQQELEKLILELSSLTGEYQTPVDLTWKGLSLDQWEALNAAGDIEDIYPLSPLQEGLYYQWLMQPQGSAYFEQMSYRVEGVVDVALLGRSYEELVKRHGVLRTSFTREYGERPLQIIRRGERGSFAYLDKSEDAQFSIESFRAADRRQGFDLHRGSQMRLQLIRLGKGSYEFVWSHHHILMDGWCVSILIKEFFEIYHSLQEGRVPVLAPVHPYSKYIEWLGKTDQAASLQYWAAYLNGYDTLSSIPHAVQPSEYSWQSRKHAFTIAGDTRQAIRTLCASLGITENTFMQTAWAIVLCKYNYTNDVVFGSVVSGRPEALEGVEDMIGLFVNTIPVRICIKEETAVAGLLQSVQQEAVNSKPHHYSQLIEVQSTSAPGKNLFDHILIFENYPVQELVQQEMNGDQGGLSLLAAGAEWQTNFDLSVMIIPQETIRIEFVYNGRVYEDATMERLQHHLQQVIRQVVADPQRGVKEIDCLLPEERSQLFTGFNNTAAAYPQQDTLISLFEKQVAITPHAPALTFQNITYTYQALNERANRLGHYLRHQFNILPDELIALQLERSELAVLATLAILKSGAGCVPVDPSSPETRTQHILKDCHCKVVIDASTLSNFEEAATTCSPENPVRITTSGDLSYIIYTSGSTGKPKGCMLEHSGVINHLFHKINLLNMQAGEALCHTSELHFVGGIWQLWGPLVTGGRVLLCSKEELFNVEGLLQQANDAGVRILELIPSQLNEYLLYNEQLPLGSISTLILTGEKLTPYFVNKCYRGNEHLEIFNTYGQTESSDVTTCYKIPAAGLMTDQVLIGSTIENMRQYIVAADGTLCPIGITGEIWTSGAGVCRGYINQPEQTAERFMDNPFEGNGRLYRTGDLGRRLPNGQLEIIGRKDNQLKIRGFRVEPAEIEAALLQQQNIEEAIVLQQEATGTNEKILIAYLVCRETPDLQLLKTNLVPLLPAYMHPIEYVLLPKMPLLPNGKADKKALTVCTPALQGEAYVEPVTDIEQRLAAIWQAVLGKERIGTRDNFFQLGGHSLKAIRLLSQIHLQFDIHLPLSALFNKPTIEGLAEEIDKINWANNDFVEMDNVESVSL